MPTDLSTYNNAWYQPGSFLRRGSWFVVNLLFFKPAFLPFYGWKRFLLRLFGAAIGKGLIVKPGVQIKYPWLLQTGDHCWIGEKVWIDNLAMVTLGNHVCISQEAYLFCGNHDYTKSTFDLVVTPIMIADGAWIGARAVVCPGVVVGSHAVLAVGSVATQSLQPFGIYQGNPAVEIKKRKISP